MGRRNIHPRHLAAAALLAAVLASCSPTGMAVGAGATAVKTAAQERSVEDAIDDNVIAAEINYLWASHDLALFRKLDTSVVEGKVVITGAVLYPQTRVEAIRLAWQADGVKQIVDEIQIEDRGDLIDQASAKFGESFVALLPSCRVWVNGEPAEQSETVESGDEIALLPPVSGGQIPVRES